MECAGIWADHPPILLRARLAALWHRLCHPVGHRIYGLEQRGAGEPRYRTDRFFCTCGREFR